MEFRVLGPLQVLAEGREIAIPANKHRVLLAALLLHANRTVSRDQLIRRAWDTALPVNARAALQTYVQRLRRTLGGGLIHTRPPGYLLAIDTQLLDLARFDDLLDQARRASDPAAEAALLAEALSLWRGPALVDVASDVLHREDVPALTERRLRAWERRIEIDLHVGRHIELVGELRALTSEHPLREEFHGQLIRALAGCSRQGEALLVYQQLRVRLADELGIDPTERLQRLQRCLLRGELTPASPSTERHPPTSVQPHRQSPSSEPAPPATSLAPARCTLPADRAVFVGRDAELEQLTTAVIDATKEGTVIAIHAIEGMPGIGKSALAVHVARRLIERFGDRQMFVDLHAHTPGRPPTDPMDALADLLAAEGADTRSLPDNLDARAAVWRARTADKRLLLILDNAASTEQVLPLLPGNPGSLVLVTSRHRLGDLPAAVPATLDVLAPDEAAAMFTRLAPRTATAPQAVANLVQACGHLPLAISITASLYTRHPTWTVGDLLHEVHRSTTSMLTVTAENRTVAAAFDLSYQHLPPERQRFFRLLGLHPGVDIDSYAAAALTGLDLDEAAAHLDRLHSDHLLEEPGYRRYRMHDLLRAYAHTLTATVDPAKAQEQAVRRLLVFYQQTATQAETLLARYTRPATATGTVHAPANPPRLETGEQAAAWLRIERANLLACIHHATTNGHHACTVGLTAGIASLLRTDGPWTQAIGLHETAATAANRLGDRHAHANALHDLADIRRLTGDYLATADLLEQALHSYTALDDQCGRANALNDLGIVRRLVADYRAAADRHQQALRLYQALDDRRGQAHALQELGIVRLQTGDYRAAADLHQQALHRYQALDDRRGQANILTGLGIVRRLTGDYRAAADVLQHAQLLYQALADRRGHANVLHDLGIVRQLTGDYQAAADLHQQALHLYQALGNRRGQANALNDLGVVRRLTGDYTAAAHLHQRAQDLLKALGDPHSEAIASTRVAVAKYLTGDHQGATDLLHDALTVFRQVQARDDEAEALNHLGNLRRLTGYPSEARVLHHQALTIARHIRHRRQEAHALEGIARAAVQQGDTTAAVTHLQQALHIHQQLGGPEAKQVAAELAIVHLGPLPAARDG